MTSLTYLEESNRANEEMSAYKEGNVLDQISENRHQNGSFREK